MFALYLSCRTGIHVLTRPLKYCTAVSATLFGYEIPFAGNMYVSHVADLNGDGHDDFINIGEDPVMLLSEYGRLVDYTEQLKLQKLPG